VKTPTIRFARLYNAQYVDFADDLPFWISMLQRFGKSVLELGCGGGRVLGPLLNAGASIIGLDHDPAMLEVARARLTGLPENEHQRGSLVCMDLLAMGLHDRFSLAIAPLNTLAIFDDAALALILRDIGQLLDPGGALVCDLPNPATALDPDHDPQEVLDSYMLSEGEIGVEVRANISTTSQPEVHHVEWIYDAFHPDGSAERITLEESYHLRTPETLAEFGEMAGFLEFETYGDYDLKAFSKDSPRLLVCFGLHP